MIPLYSWSVPGRNPGTSTKVTSGMLNASQKRTNRAPLTLAAISRVPASTAGYDYPALAELYPDDLRQLFQESVDAAAPRSVTPYWSDISSSLQNTWHPPASVNQDTPPESQDFTQQVLEGGRLL